MIFYKFIISTAAKCSNVYGYGQSISADINNKAASITAAPVNIVAIKISCPGQSTNDICLMRSIGLLQNLHKISSSLSEEWD